MCQGRQLRGCQTIFCLIDIHCWYEIVFRITRFQLARWCFHELPVRFRCSLSFQPFQIASTQTTFTSMDLGFALSALGKGDDEHSVQVTGCYLIGFYLSIQGEGTGVKRPVDRSLR